MKRSSLSILLSLAISFASIEVPVMAADTSEAEIISSEYESLEVEEYEDFNCENAENEGTECIAISEEADEQEEIIENESEAEDEIIDSDEADTTCVSSNAAADNYIITDFSEFDYESNSVYITTEERPTISQLTAKMPKTMSVVVEGRTEDVDVSWECFGDDYEKHDRYYYQFSPVFPKEYSISKDIEIKDIPYIPVFVRAYSEAGKQTGYKTAVTKSANEGKVYQYIVNNMGLNDAAACGIMANIQSESSFNPHALGDNGTSYGLCQWHNGRWTNLKNYCSSRGLDSTTVEGQLQFLQYELTNSYKGVWNRLKSVADSAEGAYDAAYYWCYNFEIPANRANVSVTRGNLAKNSYWPQYGRNKNQVPKGVFDSVTNNGDGSVAVRGWAFDPDVPSESITIHIYIGGPAGTSNVYSTSIGRTAIYREDVNRAYGITGNHGFDVTIWPGRFGSNNIYAYALDSQGGTNPLIGTKTLTITDKKAPAISNFKIENVTATGYRVSCQATDEFGIDRVSFPTWTLKNDQDDLVWHKGIKSGNTYYYDVKISEHKNEFGVYVTDVYAYDTCGNSSSQRKSVTITQPVPTSVPTKVPTAVPTKAPTTVPTRIPTAVPTKVPTTVPTKIPTAVPTKAPTTVPTEAPDDPKDVFETDPNTSDDIEYYNLSFAPGRMSSDDYSATIRVSYMGADFDGMNNNDVNPGPFILNNRGSSYCIACDKVKLLDKEGYSFAGFYYMDNNIARRVSRLDARTVRSIKASMKYQEYDIFAKWNINKYNITYKYKKPALGVMLGKSPDLSRKVRAEYNENVILPGKSQLSAQGYELIGFTDDPAYAIGYSSLQKKFSCYHYYAPGSVVSNVCGGGLKNGDGKVIKKVVLYPMWKKQ